MNINFKNEEIITKPFKVVTYSIIPPVRREEDVIMYGSRISREKVAKTVLDDFKEEYKYLVEGAINVIYHPATVEIVYENTSTISEILANCNTDCEFKPVFEKKEE